MDSKIGAGMETAGEAESVGNCWATLSLKNIWHFECFDKNGDLKWEETIENLTTNVGLDEILEQVWKGSGYTAAHYVGLTDSAPTVAAGDTMSSHAGWAEFQTYTASSPNVRPTLTLGTVASQSVDNSASKASFVIDVASPDSQTIGGGFLTTDSTIGGTSGILMAVAAFSAGDKTLNGGDTLNVTVTLTAASA